MQFGGWYATSGIGLPSLEIVKLDGDSCHNPTLISGVGRHEFNLRLHSASGTTSAMPCAGSIGLPKDKFFQWTALEDGDYWFDTRLAGFDSYVVVYDGSDCSAPCLAIANPQDHPYGQGKLLIPGVSAGAVLMIQVAADHPLLFSDDQDLAIYRDACSIPDSFEPNESIGQAAPIDSGIYLGLGVSSSTPDLDFYSFTLQPGEAIFASLENVEGGPAALHALDVAGAEIATSYSPDVPLFVNTFPWASTFYLRVDASPIWVCTRYDLHVAIVPDPCSYSGLHLQPGHA